MGPFDALVIGASFGGPSVVESILEALPADFPLPVAVVQHIAPGVTKAWAERLARGCNIDVVEASNQAEFVRGKAFIAPSGVQMRLMRGSRGYRVRLDEDWADSLHIPSVDMLMSSAAQTFGSRTLAVLLTGLGSDGANGMLAVRLAGGYTITQDEATSTSYGMPGSARRLGAVVEELPGPKIPARVVELGTSR